MSVNHVVISFLENEFRFAIKDDIKSMKDQWFNSNEYKNWWNYDDKDTKYIKCSITGIPLTYFNCEVDHKFPNTFARIVFNFLNNFFPQEYRKIMWWTKPECIDFLVCEFKDFHDGYSHHLRPVLNHVNERLPKIYPPWDKLDLYQNRDFSLEWISNFLNKGSLDDLYLPLTGTESDIMLGQGIWINPTLSQSNYYLHPEYDGFPMLNLTTSKTTPTL